MLPKLAGMTVDARWDGASGAATAEISSAGLAVHVDVSRVDEKFSGVIVSCQLPPLLDAVVLPGGVRRAVVHVALSRPARREMLAIQWFRLFRRGLSGFAESMAQAVHDFRSVVDYLRHTGVERIALTGISLGSYTSALVASVEDRLEVVIPNCPVVTPSTMFDQVVPGQQAGAPGVAVVRHQPRGARRLAGLPLPR